WVAVQLLALQGAVAVLVTLLDGRVDRLNLDASIGIAASRPTGDVELAGVANNRRHAHSPRDAVNRPHLLAGVKIVAHDAQRPRYNDLPLLASVPEHGRAVAAEKFRALRPPNGLPGLLVERRQKGAFVVILTENHAVARDDG